ncbi:hypothetical protein RND81_11G123800 [Saponaria officinalis]|uniref:Uncharacterized protein n=1 Tax=Saponaria officinalis TaxID=3572 RepID=A0AAW1HL51_SAPOF
MQKSTSPIIPGLIDDLGRECLIRIPYSDLPTGSSVSKTWRAEITGQDFGRFRKAEGVTRPVFILAQTQTDVSNLNSGQVVLKDDPVRPTYQLTVFDPFTRSWTLLPMIPGLPGGLPMFCGLVGSGTSVLVMGGWDPVTLRASSGVYIYNFLSGKWKKGADMPGVRRSFFGCATSDDGRMVVVAGGHDEDKNALKSALIYDVDKDMWTPLPDMARARDECKVIFHRGRFHVISGYPTETQGIFERTAEAFDTSTWQWGPVIDNFVEPNSIPTSCVATPNGEIYACVDQHSGDMAVYAGDRWQVITKIPADVRSGQWMGANEERKVVVIGSSKLGEPHEGYVLEMKGNNSKWSKVNVPKEYSGHVQCGCVLQL